MPCAYPRGKPRGIAVGVGCACAPIAGWCASAPYSEIKEKSSVAKGLALFGLKGGFRTEYFDHILVRFDIRPADQVDTVRHRGKNPVEGFLDRFRLSGQVQDQCLLADCAELAWQGAGGGV